MSQPAEVFIPFPGFYQSWVDMMIDDHLEMEAEELGMEEVENFKVDHEAIARAYVELYEAQLREALESPADGTLPPKFTFKELISPRFYNFETDRILCEVDSIPKLVAVRKVLMGTDSLQKDIENRFASRDGFASFYDDFVSEWKTKPYRDWDCNELSILLPRFDLEDFDLDLTGFNEAIFNNVHIEHDHDEE